MPTIEQWKILIHCVIWYTSWANVCFAGLTIGFYGQLKDRVIFISVLTVLTELFATLYGHQVLIRKKANQCIKVFCSLLFFAHVLASLLIIWIEWHNIGTYWSQYESLTLWWIISTIWYACRAIVLFVGFFVYRLFGFPACCIEPGPAVINLFHSSYGSIK